MKNIRILSLLLLITTSLIPSLVSAEARVSIHSAIVNSSSDGTRVNYTFYPAPAKWKIDYICNQYIVAEPKGGGNCDTLDEIQFTDTVSYPFPVWFKNSSNTYQDAHIKADAYDIKTGKFIGTYLDTVSVPPTPKKVSDSSVSTQVVPASAVSTSAVSKTASYQTAPAYSPSPTYTDSKATIASISPTSGPIGTIVEIKGTNLKGFEGDLDAWIENSNGEIGFLPGIGAVPRADGIIRVKIGDKLCTTGTNYTGFCSNNKYLTITPGIYRIFAKPYSVKSNSVFFTVTKSATGSTLTVLTPTNSSGASYFNPGDTINFQWSSTGSVGVKKITLISSETGDQINVLNISSNSLPLTSNSYRWVVPSSVKFGVYRVKVVSGNDELSSESTARISIRPIDTVTKVPAVAPVSPESKPTPTETPKAKVSNVVVKSLSVLTPMNSANTSTFKVGESMNISWASIGIRGVNSIKLISNTDSNTQVKILDLTGIFSFPLNTDSYSWTIPTTVPAGEYRMYVQMGRGAESLSSISQGVVTIVK